MPETTSASLGDLVRLQVVQVEKSGRVAGGSASLMGVFGRAGWTRCRVRVIRVAGCRRRCAPLRNRASFPPNRRPLRPAPVGIDLELQDSPGWTSSPLPQGPAVVQPIAAVHEARPTGVVRQRERPLRSVHGQCAAPHGAEAADDHGQNHRPSLPHLTILAVPGRSDHPLHSYDLAMHGWGRRLLIAGGDILVDRGTRILLSPVLARKPTIYDHFPVRASGRVPRRHVNCPRARIHRPRRTASTKGEKSLGGTGPSHIPPAESALFQAAAHPDRVGARTCLRASRVQPS